MSADLFITCTCSQKLSVTPADCGGTLRCSCGRMVDVPRLSDVREMSGLAAIDIGIVNKIKQQIADGALPREQNCITCNCQTANIILCEIECERIAVKGYESIWTTLLVALIAPWAWVRIFARETKDLEIHGRETSVILPMRACDKCAKAIRRSRRKRTSALLKTDLYRELFATYTNASSAIVDPKQAELASTTDGVANPYSYR